MDLIITFGDKEMATAVYIKLDAVDQLLLSEGVCRLLGIVSYDPAVEIWRGGAAPKTKTTVSSEDVGSVNQSEDADRDSKDAQVPTVRVSAVKSIRVLPHHHAAVPVEVTGIEDSSGTWIVEPDELDCFQVEESLLHFHNGDEPQVVVVNSTGFTQTLPVGTRVGSAVQCSEVEPTTQEDDIDQKNMVRAQVTWWQQKLQHLLKDDMTNPQRVELQPLLLQYHDVFSLLEDDRGETDIVQLKIDTGNAPPQRQRV